MYLYSSMLPESPRWLISNKRNDDALKILQNVAKVNKTTFNIKSWDAFIGTKQIVGDTKKETLVDAMNSPKIVIISLVLYLNW